MPATVERIDGRTVVRVMGEMTVFAANQIRDSLRDAFKQAGKDSIELDLSGVDEMDTAGLQLVLASANYAKSRGSSVAVKGVSKAVKKVFSLVGAGDYISLEA